MTLSGVSSQVIAKEQPLTTSNGHSKPAAKKAGAKRIVMLDPGHGGIDTGAIGHNGSKEKHVVLAIANDSHLMADLPWIAESIQLRNVYTDPLNVLQAELLHRSRQAEEQGHEPDPRVEQALMVTIAGVAAGMRNTG